MDKTELVTRDIDSGRRFTEALLRSDIPVRGSMWFYEPNASEWWFLVATPMVDTDGPKAAYAAIQRVLKKLDPPTDLNFRKISVVSPKDRLIKLLLNAIQTSGGVSDIRFRHNTINNIFIEDAYIYLLNEPTGPAHR